MYKAEFHRLRKLGKKTKLPPGHSPTRLSLARQRNADRYRELFREFHLKSKVKLPVAPPRFTHVYNQFTIGASDRDSLREHLRTCGIPSEIYYPIPLHLQKAFAYLGYQAGEYPESEAASREVVSLPIYPELNQEPLRLVVAAISDFYGILG